MTASPCSYPDLMQSNKLSEAAALLTRYRVTGSIRYIHDDPTEWVFIVTTSGAVSMRERDLSQALQDLLSAKVWVVTDGPAWEGRGEPLEILPSN